MTYYLYALQQTEFIMHDTQHILYIQQLKYMEALHPGALEEFETISSVRGNNMGIGQAIDLAGEQTNMKNVKAAGNYILPKESIVIYLIWFHFIKSDIGIISLIPLKGLLI